MNLKALKECEPGAGKRWVLSTQEVIGTVLLNTAANAVEDAANRLSSVLTPLQREQAEKAAMTIKTLAQAVMNTTDDDDQQEAIRRRMSVLRVNVGYVDKKPPGMLLLSESDLSTLIGHALNFCDLECPCVTVDDKTGERSVNRAAVKGCELRKLFRRIGLCEGNISAECPYSMI